jgi:predicted trehalose synthase
MLTLPGAVYRSPLADVADMLWSFHHVAEVAAIERDPTGRLRLTDLAQAWESRNRRAFLAGYRATPGIDRLVPLSSDTVQALVSVFELERSAARQALRSLAAPG